MNELGIATSWADLFDPRRGLAETFLEGMSEVPELLDDDDDARMAIMAFLNTERWGTAVTALRGPQPVAELVRAHAPAFQRALGYFRTPSADEYVYARCALGYGLLARAVSAAPRSELDVAPWLRALALQPPGDSNEGRFFALLCAAVNLPELVAAFVDGRPDPAFEPERTFGFNVQGLAHYLAAAGPAGAAFTDVQPAWNDFMVSFPHKLAAGTLDWSHLLVVSATVFHHIGGAPLATVGSLLHAEAQRRAGIVTLTASAGGQTGQRGFARITVRFEPSDGSPFEVRCALDEAALPARLREAAQAGLRGAAGDDDRGRGVRAVLAAAVVHPADATPDRFREAGRKAWHMYLQETFQSG